MTDNETTRAEQIEDGLLVDYSDAARTVGYQWGVALTAGLEERLIETLPSMGEVGNNAGIEAGVHALLLSSHQILVNAAAVSNRIAGATSFDFDFEPSWKENEKLRVRISVGSDDMGEPCFTLDNVDV